MTPAQKNLAAHVFGSAGTGYLMSDYTKRCVVGMLQTGEIAESDFAAIDNGGAWLAEIKQYAESKGWTWKSH